MSTTLLAVDDSKTIRKVLEITFAGEEFNTVLAATADEALSLVRSNAPTVALVDAVLGSTSGYDLCQQIKAQSPGTLVIVLSSKQQPYDKGRGGAAGADDFMDKPFDTQQLIDKVKTVAKNASARAPMPAPAPQPVAPAAVAPVAAAPAARAPARAQTLAYGQSPPPAAAAAKPVVATAPTPAPAQARVSSAAEAAVGDGQLAQALEGLGLSNEQVQGVLALSRDVVERVVWEVVPPLAEALIKEEIQRLTSD